MKTRRIGVAVGLQPVLGACSSTMGGTGQPPRPVAMVQATMAPDMVRQVQSQLRDGGYYKQGKVDGVWGSGTEAEMRSFQQDHGLSSSGQLDVPMLQALEIPCDTAADNTSAMQPLASNPNTSARQSTVPPPR